MSVGLVCRPWAYGLALTASLALCGPGYSQVAAPQPGKSDPDTSLLSRQEMTAAHKQRVGGSDKGKNLQPIVAFVRSTWRKMARDASIDAATAAKLDDMDIDAVASTLAMLGYTNADLRKASGTRQDIVLAAQNVLLGRPTLEDMLVLSPEVVVGELIEVGFDNAPADGFGSTAKFRVTQSVKGGIAVGAIVSVRQRSGLGADDSINADDFAPSSSGTYLMFVSKSAYGVRSQSKAVTEYYSRIMLPYSVVASSLVPTGLGQEDGRKLQDLSTL